MSVFRCPKCGKQTEHHRKYIPPASPYHLYGKSEHTCKECGQLNYIRVKSTRRKSRLLKTDEYHKACAQGHL